MNLLTKTLSPNANAESRTPTTYLVPLALYVEFSPYSSFDKADSRHYSISGFSGFPISLGYLPQASYISIFMSYGQDFPDHEWTPAIRRAPLIIPIFPLGPVFLSCNFQLPTLNPETPKPLQILSPKTPKFETLADTPNPEPENPDYS